MFPLPRTVSKQLYHLPTVPSQIVNCVKLTKHFQSFTVEVDQLEPDLSFAEYFSTDIPAFVFWIIFEAL